MSRAPLPCRTRINSSNAFSFVGKNVAVMGEVLTYSPDAQTFTLRQPDDQKLVVLVNRNNKTPIHLNLLTEVTGKLISQAQVEANYVHQFDSKQTSMFDKDLYVQATNILRAHSNYYEL